MRQSLFLALVLTGVVLFRETLAELASLSFMSELHQHIPLIPLVGGYLLFVDRKKIFHCTEWSPRVGLFLIAAGILVWGTNGLFSSGADRNDYLCAMMTGMILWLIGAFVLAFGMEAFRRGLFPLLFLAFTVPIPGFILDPSVSFLQAASADAADYVFRLSGVPFHREGMIFSLPGIDVEVAKQCSGIRSSLALVITAVLAGKLFLKSTPGRVGLLSAVIPITIFKNALRIVTLSILGAYVDPVFLTGHWLHRSGGIPFFLVGLALLSPVLWVIRGLERKSDSGARSTHLGAFQGPKT